MIYTVTFNPAIDYKITLPEVQIGNLNRIQSDFIEIGGKGIMVSKLLHNLGTPSIALGFVSGFTGDYIEEDLTKKRLITPSFIRVSGRSRINVKMTASGIETELNAKGPTIHEEEFRQLLALIEQIKPEDMIIISGSPPNGIVDAYPRISRICHANSIPFVIDTNNSSLLESLKYKPFLIKPNERELLELFGKDEATEEELIEYASALLKQGAERVIVSRGSKPSLFLENDNIYQATPPYGDVLSTTGAGDSMVAGFVHSYLKGSRSTECFRMSIAAGSATAFSLLIATEDKVHILLPQIEVTKR